MLHGVCRLCVPPVVEVHLFHGSGDPLNSHVCPTKNVPTKIACDGSDRTCGLATDGHVEVDLLGDLLLHRGARGGGASRAVKMDEGLLFCPAVQSAISIKERGKTTGRKNENGA